MLDVNAVYSFREWLTFNEVCSLVCGRDPNTYYTSDPVEYQVSGEAGNKVDFEIDDGYDAFRKLFSEAIIDDIDNEVKNEKAFEGLIHSGLGLEPQSLLDQHLNSNRLLIFKLGIIHEHEATVINFGSGEDISEAKVKMEAIKTWLEKINFKPDFFFPDSHNKHTKPNKNLKYQTSLMSIMDKAIERYYGDNFEFGNKDSYPKQDNVIEWLITEFRLSKRQAEAIEIIISPRGESHP